MVVAIILTKLCSQCNIEKNIEDFHKNLRNKDGHDTICKQCQVIVSRRYYESHKISIIIKESIKRYGKLNIKCDSYESIFQYINNMDISHCACCGCELKTNDIQYQDNSMVLGRIIPEDGFVCGNIAILCNSCNRIKNDATPDEIMLIINGMKELEVSNYAN